LPSGVLDSEALDAQPSWAVGKPTVRILTRLPVTF
jgi:hypothetical protein